jgi:hypothetical protein
VNARLGFALRCFAFALGIALLPLTACKKPAATIEASGNILRGKVYLDGNVVQIGMVHAFDEKGTPVSDKPAPIAPDGAYSFEKMPMGKIQLSVMPPPMMGALKGDNKAAPPKDLKLPDKKDFELPAEILEKFKTIENMPVKYHKPHTSELSTTIKGEMTEYDIKMTSK